MNQPVPRATADDVERIVRRDFVREDCVSAHTILHAYNDREPYRVQLAALKLAGGNLDQLRGLIALANSDYRDVLASAEYPAYAQDASIYQRTESERQRVIDADFRQYQDWLNRE